MDVYFQLFYYRVKVKSQYLAWAVREASVGLHQP